MPAPDGIALASHDEDGEHWTMALRDPHAALDGLVAGRYCGYVERTPPGFRRRETASGHVSIIISFGDSIDLVEMTNSTSGGRRLGSFVVGLHEGYAVTEHGGEQHGVQVDLTPLGAARLLGAPPPAVANEVVALEDLLGPVAHELVDRLASAPDWASRFALLDRTLVARAADGRDPDPAVVWAWGQLERSHGQVPIAVLADEIGWSRRHFGVRFRNEIGLAPKPASRVLRFRRAVTLLQAGPVRSIGDLAAACGYADHSHLVREFHSLAGCTPSQFVGGLLPDGGGVAP
jgi:AraC-like DNA-binding protein